MNRRKPIHRRLYFPAGRPGRSGIFGIPEAMTTSRPLRETTSFFLRAFLQAFSKRSAEAGESKRARQREADVPGEVEAGAQEEGVGPAGGEERDPVSAPPGGGGVRVLRFQRPPEQETHRPFSERVGVKEAKTGRRETLGAAGQEDLLRA